MPLSVKQILEQESSYSLFTQMLIDDPRQLHRTLKEGDLSFVALRKDPSLQGTVNRRERTLALCQEKLPAYLEKLNALLAKRFFYFKCEDRSVRVDEVGALAPFFEAMEPFASPYESLIYPLSDVPAKTIEALIEYIKTKKVASCNLKDLFILADYLNLDCAKPLRTLLKDSIEKCSLKTLTTQFYKTTSTPVANLCLLLIVERLLGYYPVESGPLKPDTVDKRGYDVWTSSLFARHVTSKPFYILLVDFLKNVPNQKETIAKLEKWIERKDRSVDPHIELYKERLELAYALVDLSEKEKAQLDETILKELEFPFYRDFSKLIQCCSTALLCAKYPTRFTRDYPVLKLFAKFGYCFELLRLSELAGQETIINLANFAVVSRYLSCDPPLLKQAETVIQSTKDRTCRKNMFSLMVKALLANYQLDFDTIQSEKIRSCDLSYLKQAEDVIERVATLEDRDAFYLAVIDILLAQEKVSFANVKRLGKKFIQKNSYYMKLSSAYLNQNPPMVEQALCAMDQMQGGEKKEWIQRWVHYLMTKESPEPQLALRCALFIPELDLIEYIIDVHVYRKEYDLALELLPQIKDLKRQSEAKGRIQRRELLPRNDGCTVL